MPAIINKQLATMFANVCWMYLVEIMRHDGRDIIRNHLRKVIADQLRLTEDEVVKTFVDLAEKIKRDTFGHSDDMIQMALIEAKRYAEET